MIEHIELRAESGIEDGFLVSGQLRLHRVKSGKQLPLLRVGIPSLKDGALLLGSRRFMQGLAGGEDLVRDGVKGLPVGIYKMVCMNIAFLRADHIGP